MEEHLTLMSVALQKKSDVFSSGNFLLHIFHAGHPMNFVMLQKHIFKFCPAVWIGSHTQIKLKKIIEWLAGI